MDPNTTPQAPMTPEQPAATPPPAPQPVAPQPVAPMQPPKKSSKTLMVVLLVVVLVALGGLGYWLYMNQTSTSSSSSNSNSNSNTSEAPKAEALEISEFGIKVNDPDGRKLEANAEVVCAATCDTDNSYFVKDDNMAYFDRCEYPAGIRKITETEYLAYEPGSALAERSKKVGNNYYQVFNGTNYQAPCADLQEGDEGYETELRQYIVDNMVAL